MSVDASRDACVGVLLAGGAARRFQGRPKGLATIDGVRIADRVLHALSSATDSQFVVSNDVRARTWFPDQHVVTDAIPGLGPLAGIETALLAANGASVIVVAWDMPFVPAALLRALREAGTADASAVIPVHGPMQQFEPLCAYYPASALDACSRLLAAGERRAHALLNALPSTSTLPDAAVRTWGDPEKLFQSVDTPEQLHQTGGYPPSE